MPLYEYRCGKCDEKFEVLVRSSRQKIACPKCRGRKIEKLFSVFGIGGSGGAATGSSSKSCSKSGG
jgi:putative FmdB family regulatory protein